MYTPQVTIKEPQYFPVSIPHNYDNGLGFGQGSVDGVYNQYYRGGFHRPQHPEVDRGIRRRFNLRGFRGSMRYDSKCNPYRCHYDSEPYYDEYYISPELDNYGLLEKNIRYREAIPVVGSNKSEEHSSQNTESTGSGNESVGVFDYTNTILNDQILNVFTIIIFVIVMFFLFVTCKF